MVWKVDGSTFFFLAGLNAALICFSSVSGIARPWLNLDLVVAAILVVQGRPVSVFGWTILLLSVFYESYRYVAGVFLFTISDFIEVLSYASAWPWAVIVRYVAVALTTVVILTIVGRRLRKFSIPVWILGVLCISGILIDSLSGANGLGKLLGLEYAYR